MRVWGQAHPWLVALTVVSAALAQQPPKLVPYTFNAAQPADLSGPWTATLPAETGLYRLRNTPELRHFEARVEYRSATARTQVGDVALYLYPFDERNNGTTLYGNLITRTYRFLGHTCEGQFLMDAESKRVTTWSGLCGKTGQKKTIPVKLYRQ